MKTGTLGLAVFDLDGTITRRDSFSPFVFGWLARQPWRGWRLPLALPTLIRFALGSANRGELKGQLLHVTLGGRSRTTVNEWARRHVAKLIERGLLEDAVERIRSHRQAGHRLVLMSASPDCYVRLVGTELGFDETICSMVHWNEDGTLDGRLVGANCRGPEKVRQWRALIERLHPEESWAYGNSRADLPHLLLATHGIYVNGSVRDLPVDATQVECIRWH